MEILADKINSVRDGADDALPSMGTMAKAREKPLRAAFVAETKQTASHMI